MRANGGWVSCVLERALLGEQRRTTVGEMCAVSILNLASLVWMAAAADVSGAILLAKHKDDEHLTHFIDALSSTITSIAGQSISNRRRQLAFIVNIRHKVRSPV